MLCAVSRRSGVLTDDPDPRAASACDGDASDAVFLNDPPALPRLPLPLPNANGSVPTPGMAIPGDDASLEASAERNPPPEEALAGEPERNPWGSDSAKPKIGGGPPPTKTGADDGASGESGGLDDEEGVAGPLPNALPWSFSGINPGPSEPDGDPTDPTKEEGWTIPPLEGEGDPCPEPKTFFGSNRAISALSNPNPRLPPGGGVPAFPDPASTIPTRLGGVGVSTSSGSGRAPNPTFAEPGEVARNCVARAFQLPARRTRAPVVFLSPTKKPPGDDAYPSEPEPEPPRASCAYASTSVGLHALHQRSSPRSSAASASASRKYTDASRRPPPGAAAAAKAYAR